MEWVVRLNGLKLDWEDGMVDFKCMALDNCKMIVRYISICLLYCNGFSPLLPLSLFLKGTNVIGIHYLIRFLSFQRGKDDDIKFI